MEPNLSLEDAIEYLIEHRLTTHGNLSKDRISNAVAVVANSSHEGLNAKTLKNLAETIVFTDHYNVLLKRKLLYSLIPKSKEFPYEILPLAVSFACSRSSLASFQVPVLHWLSALLEYHIIDDRNGLLHTCYSSILNLVSHQRTCGLACKILCRITRRDDVIPYHVKILVSLCSKAELPNYIENLLCIYNLYRPDLVVKSRVGHKFPPILKSLQDVMLVAKNRIENDLAFDAELHNQVWPDLNQGRMVNFHQDPHALPRPEILVYANTLEEKVSKKLYVVQYKRIDQMIDNVHHWPYWVWPNSAPTLLWKPSAIALFKPHDIYVKTTITNWLELALRTEIIQEIGNPSRTRQNHLLSACISLVKETETLIPAVYNFVLEFLNVWDGVLHTDKVLELIACIPFISSSFFFESVFQNLVTPITSSSLNIFCSFINAFCEMSINWAFQAHNEKKAASAIEVEWSLMTNELNPLEGIFFLSQRLSIIFINSLNKFGTHTLLFNTFIQYYLRINQCCEELNLPLFLSMPTELVLAIVVSGDILATHRTGLLLSNYRHTTARLVQFKPSDENEHFARSISLSKNSSINFNIKIFLDSFVSKKAFTKSWEEDISPYFIENFFENLSKNALVKRCCSVSKALPYRYLAAMLLIYFHSEDFKEQIKNIDNFIISELSSKNLSGIEQCAITYGALKKGSPKL